MIDLATFKLFVRLIDDDLDDAATLAFSAGKAEAQGVLGYKIDEQYPDDTVPSDLAMGVLLLSQVHFDVGDVQTNQYRRNAAHTLLFRYRKSSGFVAG